jgi:hypothetical protein
VWLSYLDVVVRFPSDLYLAIFVEPALSVLFSVGLLLFSVGWARAAGMDTQDESPDANGAGQEGDETVGGSAKPADGDSSSLSAAISLRDGDVEMELAAPTSGGQPPVVRSREFELSAVDSEWSDMIAQDQFDAERAVAWIAAVIDGTHGKAISQHMLRLFFSADDTLDEQTFVLLCTAVATAVTHTTTGGLRDGAALARKIGPLPGLMKLLNRLPVGSQISAQLLVTLLVKEAHDAPTSEAAVYLAGLGIVSVAEEDQQNVRARLVAILRDAARGGGCLARPLTPEEVAQANQDVERAGYSHECTRGRMLTVGWAEGQDGPFLIAGRATGRRALRQQTRNSSVSQPPAPPPP